MLCPCSLRLSHHYRHVDVQKKKELSESAVQDLLANQEELNKYAEAYEKFEIGTKALLQKAAGKIDIIANIWQTVSASTLLFLID